MKKPTKLRLIQPFLLVFFIFICLFPLGFYGIYIYLAPSIPDINELKKHKTELPLQIYTSDNKLIGLFGEKQSFPVQYKDIPPDLVHAFISAEDASFFEHSGISVKGLGRAIVETIQAGSKQSGGSTITMQVAKNYYLSFDRNLKRKLTEIVLARQIEKKLSKQDIFTLYANRIFFGQHAYGVAAAAKVYFGKDLKDLSLSEMAIIAGLPKAPSKYNPVVNPTRAMERRNWILGRMLQLGYINQSQYKTAINSPLILKQTRLTLDMNMPYVAELARNNLIEQFGETVLNSGWKVYTTVNGDKQIAAQVALEHGIDAYDTRHGWRGVESKDGPLNQFYTINNKVPAKVIAVTGSNLKAVLKSGEQITIPWSNMTIAHQAGKSSPSQVASINNIIRVKQNDNREWELTQVPQVQGQIVALNPTNGALEAMVGGYSYQASRFNRSVQGWRQPGSTIKPFIYTLALEKGFSPSSTVQDSPIKIGSWSPKNSDGRYYGTMSLSSALYLSRNMVSIRLLQAVGITNAENYLTKFGFDADKMPHNYTLALGTNQVVPLQVATGYAAFANGGYRIQPYFIQAITTVDNQIIYNANPIRTCATCITDITGTNLKLTNKDNIALSDYPMAPRIIKEQAASQMANILRDVIQHGTGTGALSLGRSDIGGKTGTTNDAKDAWFSGFHPSLVAVAWVGFDTPKSLGRKEFGGVAALPIWTGFMKTALKDVPYQWVNESTNKNTKKAKTKTNTTESADLTESTIDNSEDMPISNANKEATDLAIP